MTNTPRRERELEVFRCHCARRPVLGIIKADQSNKPFVHIKVYKQNRIYGEFLFTYGEMRLRCRECYRWHTLKIVNERPVMEEVPDEEDVVDLIPDPS